PAVAQAPRLRLPSGHAVAPQHGRATRKPRTRNRLQAGGRVCSRGRSSSAGGARGGEVLTGCRGAESTGSPVERAAELFAAVADDERGLKAALRCAVPGFADWC